MLQQADFTAEKILTVHFYDVDAMGVVWHGNYFRYFEIIRELLMSKFNYSYREMQASGYLWPIVDARIKYRSYLTYEQEIKIQAKLVEYENRLKINYKIIDLEKNKVTTTGYTIQVAVDATTNQVCLASPDVLLEKLRIINEKMDCSASGYTI